MITPKKGTLKKRSWLAWVLAVLKAKAYIGLILAILVLLVGGYIIYKLLRIAQQYIPVGSGATNNAAQITYSPGYGGIYWQVDANVRTGPVSTNKSPSLTADASQSPTFTIYYGIPYTNQVPWVGTVPVSPNGVNTYGTNTQFYVWIDTDDEYMFTVISGGVPITFDWVDGVQVSGPNPGDELSAASLNTVVVEKTTDLVNWYPIATNMCGWDTVETNVDSCVCGSAAYYRINVVSTNSTGD